MRLSSLALLWSLLLLFTAGGLLGCAGGTGAAKTANAATDPSGKPVVSWEKAMDYVGQEVVVEGTVVAVKEIESFIFVNFHTDYNNTFSIIVPRGSKDTIKKAFEGFPDSVKGKKVRVRGTVQKFDKDGKNKPEIELTSPDQLTIM